MRERGKLESLIQRHRGIGLLFLCLALYAVGSLKMEMSAVETGASGRAGQGAYPRKEKNDIEKTARFSMELPTGTDVKNVLERLKDSHTSIQIRMKGEKEGENSWHLEFGE